MKRLRPANLPSLAGPSLVDLVREEAAARAAAAEAARADQQLVAANTAAELIVAEDVAAAARRELLRSRIGFLIGPGPEAADLADRLLRWSAEWEVGADALDALASTLSYLPEGGSDVAAG